MKKYMKRFNVYELEVLLDLISNRLDVIYDEIQFYLSKGLSDDDPVVIDLQNDFSRLVSLEIKLKK